MDSNYYHKTKKEILDLPICYRTIEAKEIIALGENHYSVGNATFEVSPEIANAIDHFAGIKKEQTQIAQQLRRTGRNQSTQLLRASRSEARQATSARSRHCR